jgi:hypothetical protein
VNHSQLFVIRLKKNIYIHFEVFSYYTEKIPVEISIFNSGSRGAQFDALVWYVRQHFHSTFPQRKIVSIITIITNLTRCNFLVSTHKHKKKLSKRLEFFCCNYFERERRSKQKKKDLNTKSVCRSRSGVSAIKKKRA